LLVPNLLGEYLLERPWRSYLDPLLISCVVVGLAMAFVQVGAWFWLLLALVAVLRLVAVSWRLAQRVYEDVLLVRHGRVMQAHVLRLRPARNPQGHLSGAFLDCAIPVGPRQTSVGSVWFPDQAQAEALAQRGQLPVLCLVRPPGTWRLLDDTNPALRYEPDGSR
jgi:hypothetical protein